MEITFTVPEEHAQRVIDAFVGIWPNPGDPYTDEQWTKERIRSYVVSTVERWERDEAERVAGEGVDRDEGVIQ